MLLGSSPAESARVSTHHQAHITRTSLHDTQLAFFAVPTTIRSAHVLGLAAPAATPATTPVTAPPAPVVVPTTDANSVYTADWMCIRVHESGNRYNDPAEPSGAYGILDSTWHSFGFSGWPYQAAPIVQDALALRLYAMYGFHPWSSRFACGL
jgi:hypothetical protein